MLSLPARLGFGVFLPPFHALGENPTLSLERDLELAQWLDQLSYDELWIGEHHSGGWEPVGSPELFIAFAAERTRHIKLGTGVVSLPYHHPLMVATRMSMLDHLTRGRVMLGVGPGALVSDAYMLGIDPVRQRPMMEEALEVIVRLFTENEPFSHKSDWFELNNAVLQLKPYTRPYMPLAVASMQSPAGMQVAGRFGAGVLSLSNFSGVRGAVDLEKQWQIAEQAAAVAGKQVRRENWRLLTTVHLAESRAEAIEDVRHGSARWLHEYFAGTIGRVSPPAGPPEKTVDTMVEQGAWVVGTPDDLIEAIGRYQEASGGFGTLLLMGHEWTTREKVRKSYELLARYVMPRFQGSVGGLEASQRQVSAHITDWRARDTVAVEQAHQRYESTSETTRKAE